MVAMVEPPSRTCIKCGYDLGGLRGTQGTCPECGQYWNLTTGEGLADRASTRRQHAERRAARGRTVLLAVLAVCVLMCGGLGSMIAQHPLRPVVMGAIFAGLIALAAVTSYFYEDGE